MLLRIFAIFAVMLVGAAPLAQAQTAPPKAPAAKIVPKTAQQRLANLGTIGIITGGINSTAIQIASDLARALDAGEELRIIPMVGKGSVQNISDLANLHGVDVAIVQSDVLSHFRRTQRMPGIENWLQYVTKLYSEEFHVLSRMQYLCLQDLTGKKVNFGPKGGGTAMTAEAVFDAHKVKVQPVHMDPNVAFEKLIKGEIDATVVVTGKPSRVFDNIRYTDRVHFLDVDYAEPLQREYLPAIMTREDYPDLIAPNETVSTIAVGTVMAVVNSKQQSEQYRRVSRFVEKFFGKFDTLRQGQYHIKWQEVNLLAPVSGWQRFATAQQWLTANGSQLQTSARFGQAPADKKPGDFQTVFKKFIETRDGETKINREELFKQFVRWYQQQEQ